MWYVTGILVFLTTVSTFPTPESRLDQWKKEALTKEDLTKDDLYVDVELSGSHGDEDHHEQNYKPPVKHVDEDHHHEGDVEDYYGHEVWFFTLTINGAIAIFFFIVAWIRKHNCCCDYHYAMRKYEKAIYEEKVLILKQARDLEQSILKGGLPMNEDTESAVEVTPYELGCHIKQSDRCFAEHTKIYEYEDLQDHELVPRSKSIDVPLEAIEKIRSTRIYQIIKDQVREELKKEMNLTPNTSSTNHSRLNSPTIPTDRQNHSRTDSLTRPIIIENKQAPIFHKREVSSPPSYRESISSAISQRSPQSPLMKYRIDVLSNGASIETFT